MASTVFSQSLFSAQSSSPLPISKKSIGNALPFSVSVKQPLSVSRSHVVSTHLRKTHRSFIASSTPSGDDSSSAETPIELSTNLYGSEQNCTNLFSSPSCLKLLMCLFLFSEYPAFPTVMDINQIREILPHRCVKSFL